MNYRKISKTEFVRLFRRNLYNEIKKRALRASKEDEDYIFNDILVFLNKNVDYRKNDLLNFVIDVLANTIYENLSKANEHNSIKISLFKGMDIEAIYVPQKEKQNNLTGETITVASKIKPKATFTRTCIDKLSQSVC